MESVVEICREEGFLLPKWKNLNNILELTFPSVNHQYEGVNEGVNEGVLSELQYLYDLIAKDGGKKAVELNDLINKSLATTERYLKILKENELIEFVGASKTGGYYSKK